MKGHVTRKKYKPVIAKRREAAVVIQSNVRGYLCRRKVHHMKVIKEEEEVKTRMELEDEKAKKIQKCESWSF